MRSTATARLGACSAPVAWPSGPTYSRCAPTARANPTSQRLSPTTQDDPRSRSSICAAACAMPGIGLRSALTRANGSTVPSGW